MSLTTQAQSDQNLPFAIDQRSLSEQVYRLLLKMIAERSLMPGERLVLEDLAARFSLSRTPIQYALSRLAAEGFVQPAGRKGFAVTTITAEYLVNLYGLRLMYEQFAVEEGTASLTPDLYGQIERAAAETVRLDGQLSPEERFAATMADWQLHRLVVSLARNPQVSDLFERLQVFHQRLRAGPSPIPDSERKLVTQAEHEAVLSALRFRDAVAAKAAVRAHILAARDRALAGIELGNAGLRGQLTSQHDGKAAISLR